MKISKILTAAASILLLSHCVTTSPSQTTRPGGTNVRVDASAQPESDNNKLDKGCPLDKLQWLQVTDNYVVEKQNELADKLANAAQADAATLDRMAANKNNNPMVISSALKGVVEQMSQSRMPVSEAFFKQYSSSRAAMCAVMDALRNGSIRADQSAKVAGNTFREVGKSFEGLKVK